MYRDQIINYNTTLYKRVVQVELLITKLAFDRYSQWSRDYWCNVRKELRSKMMKGIIS